MLGLTIASCSAANTWTSAFGKSGRPPAWSKSRWVTTIWRTSSARKPSASICASAVSSRSSFGRRIARRPGGLIAFGFSTSPVPIPVSTRTRPSEVSISRQWQTILPSSSQPPRPVKNFEPCGHIVPQLR